MNEIKTAKGILKYRNPNVFENHEILRSAKSFFAADDAIGAKIEVMKNMGPLVDFSGIEGASSYDDLVGMGEDMTLPLSQIADELLSKVTKAFQKKD